jgi:L-amino acid N-acyltransferase YncA
MPAADGATVFEIYRQGIATGHGTFENSVPDDWNTWFASRRTVGRLVAEKNVRVIDWSALSAV